MLIVLVKDYGIEDANGELSSEIAEYKYRKGDKEMAERVVELTKDKDLANALYIWSINAKENDSRGFYKEGYYSGEIEIVEQ